MMDYSFCETDGFSTFNGVTETDVALRVGAALAVVFCICPFVLPKLFKVEACHP